MKCFERLVMAHINTIILETLDLLQITYRPNRSTDDVISIALHNVLSRLDKMNTYVRMFFIEYSLAFNTIAPTKLITKLRILGLNTSLCNWILDFLTGYPQVVRVGNNTSTLLILNMEAPQGCMLSPIMYSLFTQDCIGKHDSNTIIKFSDDTTVVGLITDNEETHHQQTIMVQTHQDSRKEGTTTPFPPQETEKICHGSTDPQKVIQLHLREHPDRLHHRLVWQQLGIRP
jgi:hypothetical protein